MFTYTNDERFQVLHSEGSDDWTLQIKYVQKRDNGTYECQVVADQCPLFAGGQQVVTDQCPLFAGGQQVAIDHGFFAQKCIIERLKMSAHTSHWHEKITHKLVNALTTASLFTTSVEKNIATNRRLRLPVEKEMDGCKHEHHPFLVLQQNCKEDGEYEDYRITQNVENIRSFGNKGDFALMGVIMDVPKQME
ncbi:hypothetical protein L9F63_007848, partial [Diploptera punctata]